MNPEPEAAFTDQGAVVEEVEFMVRETGKAHAIVRARAGAPGHWSVVALSDIGRRKPLVICEPEGA